MVKLPPKPEFMQQQRPSLLTPATPGKLIMESIRANSLTASVTFQMIILVLFKVT